MKISIYYHNKAEAVVSKQKISDITKNLKKMDFTLLRRCTTELRSRILADLQLFGWSDRVRINARRGLTLTAMYGKTALCLQTGNMARFYADLLKLQAQYLDGKLTSAIYILPLKNGAKLMGENLANFERLTSELQEMFTKVITIPIIIIGFDND